VAIIAPYGTWSSPIDAADAVAGLIGFAEVAVDGEWLYWLETRPSEAGRQALVGRDGSGSIADLTSPDFNARTRVHEYGGGSLTVGGGRVVVSGFTDQRLYEVADGHATPITPEPPRPASERYADGRILADGRLVCVRESHPTEGEATNEVVSVLDGSVSVLATGRDFYAAPRPSPAGDRLAWLEWDHPSMPWDGTELWVADIGGEGLLNQQRVAGGPDESVFQPEWAPDGSLVFATDRTGWWNLHRWDGSAVSSILETETDFGDAAWVFGRTTFGFLANGRILAGMWKDGIHRLGVIDPDGTIEMLPDELTSHERLVTDGVSRAWFVGAGPATPTGLFQLDVDRRSMTAVRSNPLPAPSSFIPAPRIISFPTGEGAQAHAVFYPPANPGFQAPSGELPPLIVEVHGGPTSHVYPRLSAGILYWTSRGFAMVDVNYRGSTGYGRRFRQALNGNWGIADVEDCQAVARHLAEQGEVDGARMVITGGSAGGFTALAALAFGDAFSAGASYFGIADIELLVAHTHKFESRYVDSMIGNDPEEMRRRSPLYSADRITVPVILFQGLEDQVVPPEQAEAIAAALEANGVPYAHITYEGEDHGFRKAENIVHSLESELGFYGRVFGFRPAGDIPAVAVVGMPGG